MNSNNPNAYLESLNNQNFQTKKSSFFNTINFNNDYILRFFKENLSVFIKIFYLDKDFISYTFSEEVKMEIDDNHQSYKKENFFLNRKVDIDKSFENFVLNRNFYFENTNTSITEGEQPPFNNDFNPQKKKIELKLEIIDNLTFVIKTFKISDSVNSEVSKFIIDLVDIFILTKENSLVLNEIENLSKDRLKLKV